MLLAILALAGVLRFGWLGVNSFAGDEARISLDALRLTRGGEFIYIAQQSSTGIPFLPASVWMFAPPYLLTPDPLGATLYVCLLSWLTIIGVWLLARRWGMWAGVSAALFIAASPYAVFYGRSIWQPNLLPPLALAWAWSGGRALGGRRAALPLALHMFLSGFIVQVHFAGAALALGTALLFLYGRWWRRPLPVAVGAGLALLCAVPYAVYLLTQAPQVLAQFGQVGTGDATIDLSAAGNLLHMALGYDWGYLALGEYDTYSRGLATAALAGALVGAGALALGRALWRRAPSEVPAADAALLGIWLLASPLFFLRHTTPVLPHYQLVALPVLALLAGLATTLLPARAWRWGVSAAALLLALVWTVQAGLSLDRAGRERPPQSALSSILRESRDAASALPRDQAALFFTHGDDPAISGEVAVFRVLLWDHPDARIINGAATLILPDTPAALMSTLAPFQAWEELIALGLADEVREFPRRPPGEPFVMAQIDAGSLPRLGDPAMARGFANGTTLMSIGVRRVGERLRVSSRWRAGALSHATTQGFHHLYRLDDADPTAQGIMTAPPDELGAPDYISDVPLGLHHWRAGDQVVVMADFLEIPPGLYRLVLGQYTLPDGARVPLSSGGDGIAWVFRWQP